MTQNKEVSIEQMNEAICKFMGGYRRTGDIDIYKSPDGIEWEDGTYLKYHTDWNWLHSAWEKFRDLKLDSSRHQRTHALHKDFISRQIAFGAIETAHLILWAAITWYNTTLNK